MQRALFFDNSTLYAPAISLHNNIEDSKICAVCVARYIFSKIGVASVALVSCLIYFKDLQVAIASVALVSRPISQLP